MDLGSLGMGGTDKLKSAVLSSILGSFQADDSPTTTTVRIDDDAAILTYFTDEFYNDFVYPLPGTSTSTTPATGTATSNTPTTPYNFDDLSNYFNTTTKIKTVDILDQQWKSFCTSINPSSAGNVNSVVGSYTFSSDGARDQKIRQALVNVLDSSDLEGKKLFKIANGDLRTSIDTTLTGLVDGSITNDVEFSICAQAARPYLAYRYLEVIPINGYVLHEMDHPEPTLHKVLRNLAKIVMVSKSIMKTESTAIPDAEKGTIINQLVLIPFGLEVGDNGSLKTSEPTDPIPEKSKMLEDYIASNLYRLVKKNVDDSNSLVKQKLDLQDDTEKMGIVQGNLKSLASNEERIRVRLQFMKGFLVGASIFAAAVAAAMAFGIVNGNGFVVFVVATLVICLTLAYEVYDGVLATVKVLD